MTMVLAEDMAEASHTWSQLPLLEAAEIVTGITIVTAVIAAMDMDILMATAVIPIVIAIAVIIDH